MEGSDVIDTRQNHAADGVKNGKDVDVCKDTFKHEEVVYIFIIYPIGYLGIVRDPKTGLLVLVTGNFGNAHFATTHLFLWNWCPSVSGWDFSIWV